MQRLDILRNGERIVLRGHAWQYCKTDKKERAECLTHKASFRKRRNGWHVMVCEEESWLCLFQMGIPSGGLPPGSAGSNEK